MLTLSCLKQFLTLGNGIFYSSDIEERLFWQVVNFSVKNHIEALDCVLYRNHDTWNTCKLLRNGKWL